MKKKYLLISIILLPILVILPILYFSGQNEDSPEAIKQTQKKFKLISQAITLFKSEQYFARPPEKLSDLYEYNTSFYNTMESKRIYSDSEDETTSDKEFIHTTDTYRLIPDKRIFIKSGLDEEDEKEIISSSDFITDFEFLPDYKLFQPKNTIIVWDKPGNFYSGGNILFDDGHVRFIKASPDEYERFTIGLKTRTDRDFIRDICLKNNTDCSLANIRKTQPTAKQ